MPWGVSWGTRLFRIGESPDGRRWAYFNILGFRFFRYLDEGAGGSQKKWDRDQEFHRKPVEGPDTWESDDSETPNQSLLDGLD